MCRDTKADGGTIAGTNATEKNAALSVYCDTSSLHGNLSKPAAPKITELRALEFLMAESVVGNVALMRSNVIVREVEKTPDLKQRNNLVSNFLQLAPVAHDEKVYGFSDQTDPLGGHISNPLVSDVQDEKMMAHLLTMIKHRKDAEHLTQAICNRCDIFMTLDGELLKKAENITGTFGIAILSPFQLAERLGYKPPEKK